MGKEEADYGIKEIRQYIPEENLEPVDELLKELIEKAQNDGFMEGYKYALGILKESMGKTK